jgi:CelD/BcsL family acetyltransferase involved in cellulose biosynthesis
MSPGAPTARPVAERTASEPDAAVLHPVADPRWRRFVDETPGATIFHHPSWLQLIGSRYRYPLAACCLLDERGAITAGLPVALVSSRLMGRRLVAFPFSDACPPLGAARDMGALGRAVDDLAARMDTSVEVRWTLDAPRAHPGARYRQHVLPLAAEIGEVEQRFRRSSVLRGLRRARRAGLVAHVRVDADALGLFYGLHAATRSRLGAPTQPRAFIRDLEGLFHDGLGFVLLVARGTEVAAAAVFLHHGGVLTYKYGASDAGSLQMRPNNLLFWEAIRWGCEHGMTALDLGRSDLEQQSLREFKLSWGADEHMLEYTHIGSDRGRSADRGLPGRALAATIRRTPPSASRLAGEILYRHAG